MKPLVLILIPATMQRHGYLTLSTPRSRKPGNQRKSSLLMMVRPIGRWRLPVGLNQTSSK
jgi:hypothetical protein